MEKVRAYYHPAKETQQVQQSNPQPRVDNVAGPVFNPAVANRWRGNFPLRNPEKRVVIDLEEYPNTIFQRPPSYAFFPEHSNVDVSLGS